MAFDGLRDFMRQGASELFGFGEELTGLREAAADGKLLARRVEDLGFGDLSGASSGGGFIIDRASHRQIVDRAYRYYLADPIVKRAVDLRTYYTFGTGVSRPRYRDEPGAGDDADAARGQEVVDRFWRDDENRAALTGTQAQFEKSLELQVQGNVFLVLFPTEGPLGIRAGEDGPTNLKLASLSEREVTQIVTHPRNDKVPVYYRRDFTSLRWDGSSGEYVPGNTRTLFYRDWKHEAPPDGAIDGVEWRNPPEAQIATGRVYHVKANSTSDMRFGVSELYSVLEWAKGLNDLMTSRRSTVQAIAQMAMQLKVQGTPRSVSQQGQTLKGMAAAMDSGEGLSRERATQDRTRIPVTNQSAQLQPMITDTGAQSINQDIAVIKGQIAAGTGVPTQHLGGDANATLTSSLSLDGPMLKTVKAQQKLWRDVLTDITGYALSLEGLDPDRLEVTMPPITDRDASLLATMFSGLVQVIWPNGGVERPMIRFVFGEILDAMGKENADRVLDELFPEGWKAPEPPPVAGAAPATGAGAPATGSLAATGRGRGAGKTRAAARQAEVDGRRGRRRSADERGGPDAARQQSVDRAARALEAMPDDLREVVRGALEEIDQIVAEPSRALT